MFSIGAVPDPDLEIRGGAVIQTLRQGGRGAVSKKFALKIRGGVGGGGGSPGSATEVAYGRRWHMEVRLYGLFFELLYVYFVALFLRAKF